MSAGFDMLGYASAGMATQRALLDLDAENVARSQAASPGAPVRELDPVLESADGDPQAMFADALASFDGDTGDVESTTPGTDDGLGFDDGAAAPPAGSMTVAGVRPGRVLTGSDAVSEMVNVLDAQRAYEADASIFDSGKSLITRTIDMEGS